MVFWRRMAWTRKKHVQPTLRSSLNLLCSSLSQWKNMATRQSGQLTRGITGLELEEPPAAHPPGFFGVGELFLQLRRTVIGLVSPKRVSRKVGYYRLEKC